MRHIRPFQRVGGVDAHDALRFAVVALEDAGIDGRDLFARQRFSLIDLAVDGRLEFGEHGLAEEGAAQVFQRRAQVQQALVVIPGLFQARVEQQRFVRRRGDLRHKDAVRRIDRWLRLVGQHRVHGVAPFVRQGADGFVIVRVVEQHERVDIIRVAIHIGARHLARARVHIHPARLHGRREGFHVVGAQRRGGGEHHLLALGQRERALAFQQRRIDVVVRQVLDAQHARAQLEVAVQGGQVGIGLRDQCLVDGRRQMVGVERGALRVSIVAHLRVRGICFELAVQGFAERAFILFPFAEEGVEHQLAVVAPVVAAVFGVRRLVEPYLRAVR